MSGHSKIRNKAIANIFNQMGLVEAWGTGIRRIREAAESYGIPTPEIDLNDTQKKILELLAADAQLSAAQLAEQIGIASRNVESNIKKLKEQGTLIRHGSPKKGYWEINAEN